MNDSASSYIANILSQAHLKRADVKTCHILQTFHTQGISGTKICVGDLAFKEIADKTATLVFVSYPYSLSL